MKDDLIKTDSIWYKVKMFFKKLFAKNNGIDDVNVFEKEIENAANTFREDISLKEEIRKADNKESLAKDLIDKKIDVYDLTEDQVEEMTHYFEEDIERIDSEMLRIKEHILSMKKQLTN